jgi:hypothetical protein
MHHRRQRIIRDQHQHMILLRLIACHHAMVLLSVCFTNHTNQTQPLFKYQIRSLRFAPTSRPFLQSSNIFWQKCTTKQSANDLQIWRAFRSQKLLTTIIASDSGLKHTNGTYGWKIVDRFNTTLFSGAGPVGGDYLSARSSTWSGIYGIAAPIVLIASLGHFWGTRHRAHYSWLCDSESALEQVRQLQYHETRK